MDCIEYQWLWTRQVRKIGDLYSEIQIYKEDNDIKVYVSDSVGKSNILGLAKKTEFQKGKLGPIFLFLQNLSQLFSL